MRMEELSIEEMLSNGPDGETPSFDSHRFDGWWGTQAQPDLNLTGSDANPEAIEGLNVAMLDRPESPTVLNQRELVAVWYTRADGTKVGLSRISGTDLFKVVDSREV
jgi:hypothetical protein